MQQIIVLKFLFSICWGRGWKNIFCLSLWISSHLYIFDILLTWKTSEDSDDKDQSEI